MPVVHKAQLLKEPQVVWIVLELDRKIGLRESLA